MLDKTSATPELIRLTLHAAELLDKLIALKQGRAGVTPDRAAVLTRLAEIDLAEVERSIALLKRRPDHSIGRRGIGRREVRDLARTVTVRHATTPASGRTVTLRSSTTSRTITGYAAVFYRPNDPGTEYDLRSPFGGFLERIQAGAFDAALKRPDNVRALFNHDSNYILGRTPNTLRLSVDDVGLRYEIDLAPNELGTLVRDAVGRGDIRGSSFAFSVEPGGESYVEENGILVRQISRVRLYDVGPVTFPAYEATTATRP